MMDVSMEHHQQYSHLGLSPITDLDLTAISRAFPLHPTPRRRIHTAGYWTGGRCDADWMSQSTWSAA
jgi:hypothetical protein